MPLVRLLFSYFIFFLLRIVAKQSTIYIRNVGKNEENCMVENSIIAYLK